MFRVTDNPAPPTSGDPVKSTSLTKVLLRIFSIVSFRSSIASVIVVPDVKVCRAPSPKVPSVGVPNVSCPPELVALSTYALVAKSCASTGSVAFLTIFDETSILFDEPASNTKSSSADFTVFVAWLMLIGNFLFLYQ